MATIRDGVAAGSGSGLVRGPMGGRPKIWRPLRLWRFVVLMTGAMGLAVLTPVSAQSKPRIAGPAAGGDLVVLKGNTHPLATAANDRGRVPDSMPMKHVWLMLKRAPEVQKAWLQLLDDQQNPKSARYHKWITTKEAGEQFGADPADIETVKQWLETSGFTVEHIATHGMMIDFSGTAAQIQQAFHTEIHYFDAEGKRHFANASDPQIPAALEPVVAGPVSLHDFMPKPLLINKTPSAKPNFTISNGTYLVPGDLHTIYNFSPVFTGGLTGNGVTIVALGVTDSYSAGDFGIFRKEFGLARPYPNASLTTIHPFNGNGGVCTDPGYSSADAEESILDVQWSSAAAPNATIVLASCANTQNFGGFIALDNLLTFGPIPEVVTVSYGIGESQRTTSFNQYVNNLYQVAAADGVSIFVSSGDNGAAIVDGVLENNVAVNGISVNAFASTPYNVAVGGTDFGDVANSIPSSAYWNSTNGTYFNSALSYIQEIPWNNSCGSQLLAEYNGYSQTYGSAGYCNSGYGLRVVAGSGGPSAIYTKPPFQTNVVGNPADGWRDVPDVSMFAGSGIWSHAYTVCYADVANGGHLCTQPPSTWNKVGGTSVASPVMAGVMALVDEKYGAPQGNPLARIYAMAGTTYGGPSIAQCNSSSGAAVNNSCIYYDVTQGDNVVPCQGNLNCYLPSGTVGVLSTSNSSYSPAYIATTGWDFASGIGTVNVGNFVKVF